MVKMTQFEKLSGRKLSPTGLQIKNHFVAMVGEFIGTTMFLLFAFAGTQIAVILGETTPSPPVNTSNLMFISLAFGFSLMVNVWIFFRISGGLFNPAISLAFALTGIIGPFRAGLLVVAQILGGMTAAGLVDALLPGPLSVGTALGGGINTAQGLFLEMFMTAELVFVVFMLAAEKHKATFLAPVGIGLALFIAELAGVYYTGGSLNPARSFGPAVVAHSFESYHWIYWLGPVLGAFLATGFYLFMKVLDYEQVNGDQDKDEVDVHLRKVTKRSRPHRPHFANTLQASYMHGGHLEGKKTAPNLKKPVDANGVVKANSEPAGLNDVDLAPDLGTRWPEEMV